MSVVRLLGYSTLPCGCVIGCYRELATNREVVYVEEKDPRCTARAHRQNQVVRTTTLTGSARASQHARL